MVDNTWYIVYGIRCISTRILETMASGIPPYTGTRIAYPHVSIILEEILGLVKAMEGYGIRDARIRCELPAVDWCRRCSDGSFRRRSDVPVSKCLSLSRAFSEIQVRRPLSCTFCAAC